MSAGPVSEGPVSDGYADPDRVGPAARAEAAELLARYAELVDAGDFDGVGALLSDAELLEAGGARVAAGAEEIADLYAATTRRHGDGTPGTAHVITNVIVEAVPGSDQLEVRSRFTVFQAVEGFPLQPVVVGRYVDRMRRVDGRLRFVRRTMVPERWGDPTHHLTFDPRPS